jgi:hypothetical protein
LLVATRLCQPTALINVPAWAHKTGADILWSIPADKLNDDRRGRALDAFFEQRHSIFASTTAKALQLTNSSLDRCATARMSSSPSSRSRTTSNCWIIKWRRPWAVRPVFLKSPQRVEALVTLMQIALQAYQVLERRYRQTVPENAPANEKRMTAETLLRQFRVYGCIVASEKIGRVVHAARLTSRQGQILNQLSLPTPAQSLRRILDPVPTG